MNIRSITIIDQLNQGRTVEALLVEDPDDDYIEATDKLWKVYRKRFRTASKSRGPEHDHWSWKWKLQQELNRGSFFKCYGIICDGEPQGLMLLNYGREYKARLPEQAGRSLVYLAYIESAPWNVRGYCEKPRYGGVGVVLFKAAIQFSIRLGYEGRIALHSLPDAEGFYEIRCKMRACGKDDGYEGLVYFESTSEDSLAFLDEAGE